MRISGEKGLECEAHTKTGNGTHTEKVAACNAIAEGAGGVFHRIDREEAEMLTGDAGRSGK